MDISDIVKFLLQKKTYKLGPKNKQNCEVLNKHPFNINKLSKKKKTLNHCFLIHYNAFIYQHNFTSLISHSHLIALNSHLAKMPKTTVSERETHKSQSQSYHYIT